MICDEPGCTGVHKTSRPRAEWCPRTKRRKYERWHERYTTDPQFRARHLANKARWNNANPVRRYLTNLASRRRQEGTR